jgi:crotonobetainyl-CoA:carnitine CoA-transferase CaiB-like acyl-CoA transferase
VGKSSRASPRAGAVPAPQRKGPAGLLRGIRVIDLTSVVMGPYATQILGDMGADVIKVEAPEGDLMRHIAPFKNAGMGAGFLALNRNKRSIALDLKRAGDRHVLTRLLRTADVFVFNIRPQAMRRLHLDYESLRAHNPRLIYCGAYGFSERGPYAGRAAFDDTIQAMSGMAALQGHNSAEGPAYVNTILADKVSALAAAQAITAALFERERSGQGQAVEVPMFETVVSFLLAEHLAGATFEPPQADMGYERLLSPYRRPHRTKDGYIGLLPYTSAQWRRFFQVAGRPDLADDARFTDLGTRSRNITALYTIMAELVAQRTTAEWLEALGGSDIPMSPVLSPQDLLHDPHLNQVGLIRRDLHPSEGEIRTVGTPVDFSRTPCTIERLAPRLNEHRAQILAELDRPGAPPGRPGRPGQKKRPNALGVDGPTGRPAGLAPCDKGVKRAASRAPGGES